MLSLLIHWIRFDDSDLRLPKLSGTIPSFELGRPMMLLNVLTEFCGDVTHLREKYKSHFEWAVHAILKHVSFYNPALNKHNLILVSVTA